nr:MAG TPA: hypothetical protein [Caudoviricetes sp.]
MRRESAAKERDPKTMSDEDLHDEMEKRYGNDFDLSELDADDPLVVEFADRISRGQ